MRVANGNGKRVGSIVWLWRLFKPQKHSDHCNDLLFFGASIPHHRLLDLKRRIFLYWNARPFCGEENHAARFGNADTRGDVGVEEQLLDRNGIGTVFLDQLVHAVKNPF